MAYGQIRPQLTAGIAQPGRQPQGPRPCADADRPVWAQYGCISRQANGPSEPGQHLGECLVGTTSDHAGFTVNCDERHVGLGGGPSDKRPCRNDLPGGRARWWTFAGWKANLSLARMVEDLRAKGGMGNDLRIAVDAQTSKDNLAEILRSSVADEHDIPEWVVQEAVEGLKFSECLPSELALEVVTHRLTDPESVSRAVAEKLSAWHFT